MGNCITKPKLCFFTDVFIVGGVERVLIETIKLLHDKYDITLNIASNSVDYELLKQVDKYANVEIGELQFSKSLFLLLSIKHIGAHILKKSFSNQFDCLIVCKPIISNIVFSNVSKNYIYWNHGDKDILYANKNISLSRRINKMRLSSIYNKYDLFLSVTPEITKLVALAFDLKNAYTLLNPIDINNIINKSKKDNVHLPNNKFNICAVGRLSKEKAFDKLITDLTDLNKSKYQVIILGDGPEKNNLNDLIIELHLESNVFLLGNKDNPYGYIKNCDLLVSSSIMESFGLSILEAMILKVPVLATNTSGARFLLKNGKLGHLAKDDLDFKLTLSKIINNPDYNTININDAYEFAQKFSFIEFKKQIIYYIESVINK